MLKIYFEERPDAFNYRIGDDEPMVARKTSIQILRSICLTIVNAQTRLLDLSRCFIYN